MWKTIILAGSAAVIVMTTAPASAQVVIERRVAPEVVVPDRNVIIRERTGSVDIDDEDCVKTKTTRTDAVTGDRETRVRKECD